MRAVYGLPAARVDARGFDAVLIDTPLYVSPVTRPGTPVIGVIHDLLPISDPTIAGPWRRLFMRKLEGMLRASTHLQFVSEVSRSAFAELFAETYRRLPCTVLPPVLGPTLLAQASQARKRALRPGRRPYMFALITSEVRKNAAILASAWVEMANDVDLIIAGATDEAVSRLFGRQLGKQVHILGQIAEDHKFDLIRGAHALVTPSLAEGFGIPIVEAALLDTPVIASDIPVYREVTGGAATFFAPRSAASLAAAVKSVLADPDAAAVIAGRLRSSCLARFGPDSAQPVFAATLAGGAPR
jgi:glycosyltransferase involved in cell wall biosynthesis